MSSPSERVGLIQFTSDLTTINTATAVPTTATNGVAVPNNFRCTHVHLRLTKSNTASVDIWARDEDGHWLYADRVTASNACNELFHFSGLSGAARLATVITACGTGQFGTNTAFGFSEG